jgi:hypothetical protein
VAGGRRKPRTRVGRGAGVRPALCGDRERLLDGVLREVEVAEEADQVAEHATPLVPEDEDVEHLEPERPVIKLHRLAEELEDLGLALVGAGERART